MTTFQDRERAFESKFALDQEQDFRAHCRRDRWLGLWAGGVLGKTGDELTAYAQAIVKADFEHPGEEDVARRVEADLAGRPEAAQVRARMAELLARARREVAEDVVGHN